MTRFSTKRTLAMVVAITMILCLVPIVSMAASISNLSIDYDDVEDKYVVSGTTSEFSSGGQVTMLVIYADGELKGIPTELDENYIMYIDQKDPDGGGSFSWEFTKRDTAEERSHMTVFAGGSDVDTVGYASYEMPEDLLDGPEVIYDAECYVGENIVISFDAIEFAAWADNISIEVNEGVLGSGDFTLDKGAGTITIPTDEAILHNIVISAEGYEGVVVSVNVALRPAGVVALGDYSTLGCFVEGTAYDAVFTITDSSPEGWLENLVIDVVDSEGNDAGEVSVNEGTGTITFTNAVPDDKTLYALTFDAADDYAAVEDIEFYIISKAGAALSSVKAATYDADTDPNKYSITVPGDYTDDVSGLTVAYSVTVDGVDKDISTSRTFDVVRPADDGDADNVDKTPVIVTATVGEAADNKTKVQTIDVLEVGASGSSIITEDDVTLLVTDAYGKTGYTLVKIVTTNVTTASETLMIGDYEMFYSPVKNAFYGILQPSNIDNELTTLTAADIVNAAAKESKVATSIYFGKANNTTSTGGLTALDAAAVKKIILKTATNITDDMLITADVNNAEPDGNITALDVAAIKKVILNTSPSLPVNN